MSTVSHEVHKVIRVFTTLLSAVPVLTIEEW